MKNLLRGLTKSIIDLFHPKILILMFIPPVIALIFWGLVAFFSWPYLMAMAGWMISWAPDFLQSTSSFIAVILAIGMVLPLAVVSVLIFTSVLAMPIIVPHVAHKYYPTLQKNNKGALAASLKNALWTGTKYLILWFITLPLWLVPGLSLAVPLVLNAYLNYKLFVYDALSEHGSPSEIADLVQSKRAEFYVLGLITSALMITPIVFLIAPFYAGLTFSHMALGELADQRLEKTRRSL